MRPRRGRRRVPRGTGVITIRHAKFDRPRLVPLHDTTTAARRANATERDRLSPARSTAFFVSGAGTRLLGSAVAMVLRQITTAMGLRSETVRPTPHQLRHSFAVRTLVDWHRNGVAVARPHRRPVDLPGTRQPGRHLLVSVSLAGADGTRRRTARHPHRRPTMSAARPRTPGLLHRPPHQPTRRQPQHRRRLQDRPPSPGGLSPPNAPAQAPACSTSPRWTRRSSPRSSTISSATATTA